MSHIPTGKTAMPIFFTIETEANYFLSRYVGKLSDTDLVHYYSKDFFGCGKWVPGANELVDLSQADLGQITAQGVEELITYRLSVFKASPIKAPVKVAVYATRDLGFGLARMYEALTDTSLEELMVFRSVEGAVTWLASPLPLDRTAN